MKEQIKTPEKNTTKQWRDGQPIRYTVQNTGYQDAPGTHWVLQQHKKDPGNNEGHITWNKKKISLKGTNSDWKEARAQLNGLEQKERRNIQPELNAETRIQKNEVRLRNLQDNFKCSNIQIIGVPEGEEEDQEIENLFKQIMEENFPNLAEKIDFHKVQEAQRVPKTLEPRRNTPKHIIITLAKIKDKERILEAAREKDSYRQRSSHKTVS